MDSADVALVDVAKCLVDPIQCELRRSRLDDDAMRPLAAFVDGIRKEHGNYGVPHFDPLDGGVNAECLFLLEAPGPQAVATGFISRNNPDETAKNWFKFNEDARIDRKRTLIWNIVPWYVGNGDSIRPVTAQDIESGLPYLKQLLLLLKNLKVVVLVGRKAGRARSNIQGWYPRIPILDVPHPSPKFVNRLLGNRGVLLAALAEVQRTLNITE
jgi:uracil-DNA glycosylase